jgi:hypothetical protein
MRYLFLAALLSAAAAPAQERSEAPRLRAPGRGIKDLTHCKRADVHKVQGVAEPGARKLNEMPQAEPIYTVLNEVDGCPVPVSVIKR